LPEQEVPNFLLGLFGAPRKERRIDTLFSGTNSPAQGAKKYFNHGPQERILSMNRIYGYAAAAWVSLQVCVFAAPAVDLQPVVTGIDRPVAITNAGG
jgi:hypothetical protein